MFNRHVALIASAAAVTAVVGVAAAPTRLSITRVDNLTFSQPVALPGVTLAAGTYAFESGPGNTDPNIVRVTTLNRQKVLFLGFTAPIGRSAANRRVLLGESAPGQPTPILAWYPTGSDRGQEFRYR